MKESINLHVNGSDLQTTWQDEYDGFIDGVTFILIKVMHQLTGYLLQDLIM